jgi:hypothetical protein
VKSREGFSGMIPTNICANISFSIMQKNITHGLNSKTNLITQTPSSQFFKEFLIRLQTWQTEISQKSILVKVNSTYNHGISTLNFFMHALTLKLIKPLIGHNNQGLFHFFFFFFIAKLP